MGIMWGTNETAGELTAAARSERVARLREQADHVPPAGQLRVRKVILGDTKPEELTQDAPVVHLLWIGGHGIECETLLVGAVARSVRGILDSAGLPEGASCFGSQISVAELLLFRPGAFGTRQSNGPDVPAPYLKRALNVLLEAWEQIRRAVWS